jgi:hypothetical protein
MSSIQERLQDHYNEALEYFPEDRIVGIFLQGSQNYKLDLPTSDVDTKLIVTPTFEEIAFNEKPYSTTHIRENEERIDFKDIRLMLSTFRKQNLNFLEILFTEYAIINPLYADEWNRLVDANEDIAHFNRFLAVKAMKGVALEKYHAMEHRYPSKIEIIDKMGYDPKQLHHLLRVEEYLSRYIAGEPYADCLISKMPEHLKAVKMGKYDLETARKEADKALLHIEDMCEPFTKYSEYNVNNKVVSELLDSVQYNIMKKAIQIELI